VAFLHNFNERTRQIATVSIIWVVIATGSILLYLFDPANPADQSLFPSCPFRTLTGLQCPGCGTLRGLHQLIHGHPLATFKLNPLLMVTLPFLLYLLFLSTRAAITGRPPAKFFIPSNLIWVFLGVVLFFWIFRNTSLYPFVS
jgi:Protein of unknown function (DUF2752)